MAVTIYDVIRTEELNRGERVEMVVDIYESSDTVRGQKPSTRMEDTSPKTTQQTQHPVVITVHWIKFTKERDQLQSSNTNLTTERDQLQANYTNLTVERDQLQTSYTNLTTERDQLQANYTNLTVERDQLQTSYTNLTTGRDQLQTRYTNLAKERDQLQTSNTNLVKERDQLQTSNTNLAKERDQIQKERDEFSRRLSELETLITQQEWIYFSSSIYYISTERKSWRESRQHCKGKGADLVIINSREKQDFINRLRGYQTAWIGLIYRNTEEDWRWVDDSPVAT
ncbi:hypothetical protein NFI96_029834 [Prochilodus magdalenae]|nr:hypothetical protein NFI96_029834 [Prochilodus magdalenae]